jgi:hypothetical protein
VSGYIDPSNSLRSCAGCSAHILTNDTTSEMAWCAKCKPKHVKPFDEWAATVQVGSRVYLQPYASFRGLSHSEYLVTGREGDKLTVQLLGWPESSQRVNVAHAGQHDLTPRRLG